LATIIHVDFRDFPICGFSTPAEKFPQFF